jgi:hypothetical protein
MFADLYDTGVGSPPAEPGESVEVLADLAAGGTVLELAIGTGRVALPLAARGLSVHGIDAVTPSRWRSATSRTSPSTARSIWSSWCSTRSST